MNEGNSDLLRKPLVKCCQTVTTKKTHNVVDIEFVYHRVWRFSYEDIIVRQLYGLQSCGCLKTGLTDQKFSLITVEVEKQSGLWRHGARGWLFFPRCLRGSLIGLAVGTTTSVLEALGKEIGKKQHQGTWSSQSVTPSWLLVTESSWCCSEGSAMGDSSMEGRCDGLTVPGLSSYQMLINALLCCS